MSGFVGWGMAAEADRGFFEVTSILNLPVVMVAHVFVLRPTALCTLSSITCEYLSKAFLILEKKEGMAAWGQCGTVNEKSPDLGGLGGTFWLIRQGGRGRKRRLDSFREWNCRFGSGGSRSSERNGEFCSGHFEFNFQGHPRI